LPVFVKAVVQLGSKKVVQGSSIN